MGTWQLEVVKMAAYIAFPVALFHWFNQPSNFEEWVIKVKRQYYPPENLEATRQFKEFIREYNEKIDKEYVNALEEAQKKFDQISASQKK